MKILHHPDTLLHEVPELTSSTIIPSYESPSRITSILSALSCHTITVPILSPALTTSAALLIHPNHYLHHLRTIHSTVKSLNALPPSGALLPECFPPRNHAPHIKPPADPFARLGFYAFDLCSAIVEDSYRSILTSADLARQGALSVFQTPSETVFSMCRPPGHHCGPQVAGGYCYLNNTGIAAAVLREQLALSSRGTEQITILDIDFHHGNGTQEIFYATSQPAYISIHGEGEFPYYSGYPQETGEGEGEGFNINLPLPVETTGEVYAQTLKKAMREVQRLDTRWLVVSFGGDTVVGDPVGRFALEVEEYRGFGEIVGKMARGAAVLVVLEGGYRVEVLGEVVRCFLEGVEQGRAKAKGLMRPEPGMLVLQDVEAEDDDDDEEKPMTNGV